MLRGLVLACARPGDQLCHIAGDGCPYTLPIAGEPLIRHSIRSLAGAGIEEVFVLLAADIFEDVAGALGDVEELGVAIHYGVQPELRCAADSLRAAREVLGDGPVALHLADSIAVLPDLWESGSKLFTTSDGDVIASVLLPDDVEEVAATSGASLREALRQGGLEEVRVDDAWRYDDTVDGVLEGNRMALDAMRPGPVEADLSRASVQGRVRIHPSAQLVNTTVRGPAVIGPDTLLNDTFVGPSTAIGPGVHLDGVEIENSIVMQGAHIRFPGSRLEASLVGENARIGRDFALPSALRLRIGRSAQIHLS